MKCSSPAFKKLFFHFSYKIQLNFYEQGRGKGGKEGHFIIKKWKEGQSRLSFPSHLSAVIKKPLTLRHSESNLQQEKKF
jgi:hypothetical protein